MRTTEENMKLFIRIKQKFPLMVIFISQSIDDNILIYEQGPNNVYIYSKIEYATLTRMKTKRDETNSFFALVPDNNDRYRFSCIDDLKLQIKSNKKCYLTEDDILVNIHIHVKKLQAKATATLSIYNRKNGQGRLKSDIRINLNTNTIWDIIKGSIVL